MANIAVQSITRDVFDESIETIRERVRKGHMYGCGITGREDIILRQKPKYWANKPIIWLESEFLHECAENDMIMTCHKDLMDVFNTLLQE